METDWGGHLGDKFSKGVRKLTKGGTEVPQASLRGSALIISNDFKKAAKTEFIQLGQRLGAKKDRTSMQELFSSIVGEANVTVKKNLNKKDFEDVITNFKRNCLDKSTEFCVIIFMSYGFQSDTLYCSDGEPFNLYDDLVYKFNRNYSQDFKNKPRIFLIQTCGIEGVVKRPQVVEAASDDQYVEFGKYESHVSNIFVGRSSLPHLMPRASTTVGTHYIQAIKTVLEADSNWKKVDLVTLHKMVRNEVLAKDQQTP